MLEDMLLVWELNHGSKEALRRIYEKYRNDLLRLAVALLNDVSAAEDIVQDVFVCFAQSTGQTRVRKNLKGYLATSVANRARNKNRASQPQATSGLNEVPSVASNLDRPERWVIFNEEFSLLGQALGQLPYEQREAILLHLHGRMKFKEIARLQNISVKTAQSRYRYGLDKLRSKLNSEMQK
jgi:RNA polymerase sigma-70 factor (ECF subfamily)